MKRTCVILTVLGIVSILLSQIGCEEAQKPAQEPQKVVQATEKPAAIAKEATEPAKPKPEPVKPEPVKPEPVNPKPEAVKAEPVRPKPQAVKPKPEPEKPKADANAPGPEIRFDKMVHDFGDVGPGTANICEFDFKNVGETLLKIIDVKPDCGCTIFTLDKKEYEPGESGVLKIKFHAPAPAGLTTKRIAVTSNDKAAPTVTLTLKATVVARVDYQPKTLNLLLKDEDKALPKVTLTSIDGRPFSVTSVKSTANAISADFDASVEATKIVLLLKVDKTQLQKVANGVVEISLTHPEAKAVNIPFSALTRFSINPVIILFDAEPGKPIIRNNVTILNNYEEQFEIASVKSKEGITKVLRQDKIANGYMFSLEITPPTLGGSVRRFTDEFSIQIKDGELLTIKCQGYYSSKSGKP
jgi:hypothetical protein